MMTSEEFIQKAIDIASNYHSTYIWGGLGRPITEEHLANALEQYPDSNGIYCQIARSYLGDDTAFLWDCVGLIKTILWNWSGDHSNPLGGAKYESNGVPDTSADNMISQCPSASMDFDVIVPGEALWMPGHIGIYIGNGLGVECTPAWANGVQITAVANIRKRSDYPNRTWVKHGKLPWVEYGDPIQAEIDALPDWARPTIQKLVERGSLQGDGVSLGLTNDLMRTLVILDRMGCF